MKRRDRIIILIIVLALAMAGHSPTQAAPNQPVYAIYYLWWSTQHWKEKLGPNYPYSASPLPLPAATDADGCNAISYYAGNQLLDVPATLESQDTPGVIENDIRTAKNAGLAGFWLNWTGDGTTTQTRTSVTYTRRLAEAFAASNRVGGFKNWVDYKVASKPPTTFIINDLNFLYNEFKNETAWERINGKPIVTFATWKYSDAELLQISSAIRDRMFLVGDETRTTLTTARIGMLDAVTYYWSSQDPYGNPASFSRIKEMGDKVHAAGKRWYAPINPGYNSKLLDGSGSCIPRRNGETIHRIWNGNSASNPDGWAFISWNEIAENSHIKPMQKWGSSSLNALSQLIKFNSVPATTSDFSYGWTVSQHVRTAGDVNGDGKADLVGFGSEGVYVALSNGSGFEGVRSWSTDYGVSQGWAVSQHVRTVGDVNGDGKADLVGFGSEGVYVGLSTGSSFSPLAKWTSAFDLAHGWTVDQYVRTVADVNGDRMADLVGFGLDGVYVALSYGNGFGAISKKSSSFDLSHGWTVAQYVRTVGDINGDNMADLVGFGLDGVYVALSQGSTFDSIRRWTTAFDLSHGWTVSQYVRTVGDVNGDGKADLIGFGLDGVYFALSTGSTFDTIQRRTSIFDLAHGWSVMQHVRTIGDVSGDAKTDLLGFSFHGVFLESTK